MGTLVRVEVYAPDESQAEAAFRAAFGRIHQLDQILSDYLPDSELNRVCWSAVGQPVVVSDDLFRVLEASQQLASNSDGAFDVTLGPVIRLWREARKQHVLPDTATLQQAARRCGYRKLHLNSAHRTVMLDQAGMQLDLGGIAKGYTAEEALLVIRKLGIRSALVAASGDLAFSDAPPGTRGWRIGIDSGILQLVNAAVSTSGGSEQFLEVGGKRYSHIVDPSTEMGLTRDITVTVVAPHGATADGMATAISVLGPERAAQLVDAEPGSAALVLVRDSGGNQSSEFGAKELFRMVK